MKRGGPLARRTPLARGGRLPFRSKKAQKIAPLRAAFVRDYLAENPWCAIRWDDGCQGLAVDVDEPLSRAQGGSILSAANAQAGCRYCHDKKHNNPSEAERRGFTVQRRHLPSDAQEAS